MIKRRRKKNRVAQLLWSVLGALVVGYFIYHTIQGDRGLFAMLRLQQEVHLADSTLVDLQEERKVFEHKTKLLRNNSMDPDLLEEKSRELLNYSKPNEIIILTPEDNEKK